MQQTFNKIPTAFDAYVRLQVPKGTLYMSLISKRLVGIVASTLVLSLVSAAAHAQGTWYTDRATWESLVTNVRTAGYNSSTASSLPITQNGVTATKTGSGFLTTNGIFLSSSDTNIPITFTFSGNAFFGEFNTQKIDGSIGFSIDGSLTNIYTLTNLSGASSKFLGYISNSGSNISVKLTPNAANRLQVNSFSRGSSIAPEPGSFALALTGGAALIGICVRRRRNAG